MSSNENSQSMASVTLQLPAELVGWAEEAGLMSDGRMAKMLVAALRREAGRKLLELAEQVQSGQGSGPTDAEVVAQIKALHIAADARRAKAAAKDSVATA